MKKILLSGIMLVSLSGCGTQSVESTYTVPAQKEKTAPTEKFTTDISGNYLVGNNASKYISGDEKEFTTAKSGRYTVGEDIKPGLYDIVALEGSGNVQTDSGDLNEIMQPDGSGIFDEMYVPKFENMLLQEDDVLEVSGVSVKLVPVTEKSIKTIPAGKYDLKAVKGSGNVQSSSGINEIMGKKSGDGFDDMYTETYDNAEFSKGDILQVTGVSLDLVPEEKTRVVSKAKDAYDVTEKLAIEDDKEVCYVNDEEKPCDQLKDYDKLKKELSEQ